MPKLMKLPTIEALLSVARGRVSANAVGQLADLGLYLDGDPDPSIEAEKWARAVKVLTTDLFPTMDPIDAQRRIAHLALDSFTGTLVGKVMVTVGRMIGRERSLQRLTHNFRTGTNFIECRITPLVNGVRDVWVNDVSDVPGFYAGMLEYRSISAPTLEERVDIHAREGTSATFRLTQL